MTQRFSALRHGFDSWKYMKPKDVITVLKRQQKHLNMMIENRARDHKACTLFMEKYAAITYAIDFIARKHDTDEAAGGMANQANPDSA